MKGVKREKLRAVFGCYKRRNTHNVGAGRPVRLTHQGSLSVNKKVHCNANMFVLSYLPREAVDVCKHTVYFS